MRVDYGASVSEVYQYTARYIINCDRNPDVLCILSTHPDANSADLPTGRPTGASLPYQFRYMPIGSYLSYKFGAAGSAETLRQDQENIGILVVQGFILTSIIELVPIAITLIPHLPEDPTGNGETLDWTRHHRQLALTRSGNAIVPVQNDIEDEVWVIWRCKMPIVLRIVGQAQETKRLVYAVVGPCYVPVYIWGRGLKEFLKVGEELQEILLV
jgi:hypothetical protein